ncbi:MAG: penicillin-binding protein activator [Bauldia sp.]|nr:penicillin-binding protein activator [Bauldia sp.]MCW5716829.1 penicillin-binding protein activator [Bauldia sp.]
MRQNASWSARGLATFGTLIAGLLLLAACNAREFTFTGPPPAIPTGAPVTGEVLGTGTIRVALLVPLSANGNAAEAAQNIRNAAQLALREFSNANIQILVKDDLGTPEGARAAATEAISQGAELILGPLFAASVSAAAEVARPQGIPMIAFSTDVSVATAGVYLLSFLPRNDVQRIIPYAARNGYTNIAALLPDNAYGTLAEAALREIATASGIRIVAVQRYALDRSAMQPAAEAIADLVIAGQADAVFMPDGGDAVPFLAQIMAAKGIRPGQIQFLGSGQWNDDRIRTETALAGGWYPGPDLGGFRTFSSRYSAAFGTTPFATATLGYDATILAAGLAANFGPARFAPATITNPNGFRGIDGAFRFLSSGLNQRALAIYEIDRSGTERVVDPAPAGFAGVAAASPATTTPAAGPLAGLFQ